MVVKYGLNLALSCFVCLSFSHLVGAASSTGKSASKMSDAARSKKAKTITESVFESIPSAMSKSDLEKSSLFGPEKIVRSMMEKKFKKGYAKEQVKTRRYESFSKKLRKLNEEDRSSVVTHASEIVLDLSSEDFFCIEAWWMFEKVVAALDENQILADIMASYGCDGLDDKSKLEAFSMVLYVEPDSASDSTGLKTFLGDWHKSEFFNSTLYFKTVTVVLGHFNIIAGEFDTKSYRWLGVQPYLQPRYKHPNYGSSYAWFLDPSLDKFTQGTAEDTIDYLVDFYGAGDYMREYIKSLMKKSNFLALQSTDTEIVMEDGTVSDMLWRFSAYRNCVELGGELCYEVPAESGEGAKSKQGASAKAR